MDPSDTTQRLRVLCVDDEPRVLEGLELRLRRHYDVEAAFDGATALQIIKTGGPFAIVISDMRMPGMDGATLLTQIREIAPDTVRILLTGFADTESAVAAVNGGQIFRFLTKPCNPDAMMSAMKDAEAFYRLVTAERDLLERTLRGAVQAMSDIVALMDPDAFGRAALARRLALAIAAQVELQPRWPLELAAMMSTMGQISLPPEVLKRMHNRDALSDEELAMVARVPEVTDKLLSPIPRLEAVRDILRQTAKLSAGGTVAENSSAGNWLSRSARILRLATDCEDLEFSGEPMQRVLVELQGRKARYEPELLQALATVKGVQTTDVEVREILVRQLQPGMVLDQDLVTVNGLRLVARGYEVTSSFVERMRNVRSGTLHEPIRVILPRKAPASGG